MMLDNCIFVYGTLKKNGHYHYFLKDSLLVSSEAITKEHAFSMEQFRFDSDHGALSPGVYEGGSSYILGEIYKINDETLNKLDALEEEGVLFKRKEVGINGFGQAWMYVLINQETSYQNDVIYVDFIRERNAYMWRCD